MRTDDPIRDQLRHDADLEDRACLHCAVCGGGLYDGDPYYEIDDMELCPDCMIAEYRRIV